MEGYKQIQAIQAPEKVSREECQRASLRRALRHLIVVALLSQPYLYRVVS